MSKASLVVFFLVPLLLRSPAEAQADRPLPSWSDGPARDAILAFVQGVCDPVNSDYLPPQDRIATFDNDGTLWCEQPMYVQLRFALDRLAELAPAHPEWRDQPAISAALSGDLQAAVADGYDGLIAIVVATHSGVTTAEFQASVTAWLAQARHPRFGRPYDELVYQPMIELLDYLRTQQFRVFIVSGGGSDFMRTFTDRVYGVPTQDVIGTTFATRFEARGTGFVLNREPKVAFVDDGPGKPVGIHRHIGRRPVMAFGNSDGDLQMLQWTTTGDGPRFGAIVHHTDAEREYAYDRESSVGRLNVALDQAAPRDWTLIDMKRDWATVFPPTP